MLRRKAEAEAQKKSADGFGGNGFGYGDRDSGIGDPADRAKMEAKKEAAAAKAAFNRLQNKAWKALGAASMEQYAALKEARSIALTAPSLNEIQLERMRYKLRVQRENFVALGGHDAAASSARPSQQQQQHHHAHHAPAFAAPPSYADLGRDGGAGGGGAPQPWSFEDGVDEVASATGCPPHVARRALETVGDVSEAIALVREAQQRRQARGPPTDAPNGAAARGATPGREPSAAGSYRGGFGAAASAAAESHRAPTGAAPLLALPAEGAATLDEGATDEPATPAQLPAKPPLVRNRPRYGRRSGSPRPASAGIAQQYPLPPPPPAAVEAPPRREVRVSTPTASAHPGASRRVPSGPKGGRPSSESGARPVYLPLEHQCAEAIDAAHDPQQQQQRRHPPPPPPPPSELDQLHALGDRKFGRGAAAMHEAASAAASAPPDLSSSHDARRAAAKERRDALEEARRQTLLQKRRASEASSAAVAAVPIADGGVSDAAAAVGESEKDLRMRQARERRERAEEARKAALLQKRAEKARPDVGSGGPASEIARLEAAIEALPPGKQGDAARVGLKKQLASQKAILVREQRKKEMAAREAARAAAAPPPPPPPQPPPQVEQQQTEAYYDDGYEEP